MTSTAQQSVSRLITVWAVALAMVVAPLALTTEAHAETPQEQARKHYEAGSDLYASGDFRGAIREFETANRLAPSPILDFNIGLAYERLNELDKALVHYKAYINAMPNAGNRVAVDAKIASLERELAERDAISADTGDAGSTTGATMGSTGSTGTTAGTTSGTTGSDLGTSSDTDMGTDISATGTVPGVAEGAGITAPGGTVYEPTGNPKLDRVATIDVAQIRDQRAGQMAAAYEASSGPAEPAVIDDGSASKPKKSKPIYKQWWFWVVAGVSAVILINMASGGDDNAATPQPASGPVLIRF